ncbi:MAG: hypothetical protein HFF52_00725 [Lawsonibacter sp.]|nr:hypothetical protein [Lawsonibacter sp.]
MNNRELEQRLAHAVEQTAPNDLDAILSRCGTQNGSVMEMKSRNNIVDLQENVIEMVPAKSKKHWGRWLAAACAALVLLGTGGGGLAYYQSCAVASVVSLDVNPSIELRVNRGERVISCTALNEEAAAVLFSMGGGDDLKGTKLDVAVNAIVGALVQAGYMDSISSAILISVEDKDQERAQRLQQELVASVDGVLQAQAPGTSVLSQVLTMDAPALNNTPYDSGLSAGKAALVRKVMEMNGTIAADNTDAFDKLAALSVEELNDLLKAGEKRIPIGKDAAAIAAYEYSGTLALDSVVADVDPELDKNPPHYEVELKTAWGEFDYIVDAFTGAVLSGQKDLLNNTPGGGGQTVTPPPTSGVDTPVFPDTPVSPDKNVPQTPSSGAQDQQDVGQDAAKQAALNHAGLTESQVTGVKVEREWDDGRLEYDVEFWCGSTEYDYTIDGHSCSVLKHELEHHLYQEGTHHNDSPYGGAGAASGTGTDASFSDIGPAAAKAAALSHAGVAESQTTKMKVERDWDDGWLEYKVEFKSGGMEYEYTIDGVTGAVLEHESEWDD